MQLKEFLGNHVSNWKHAEFDAKAFICLPYSTEVRPSTYLEYSQNDLETALGHRHINAMSNVKRAIDCQLENIFQIFGLAGRRNFPSKLELIAEMGLLAPRIIRKVSTVRNVLEHEFFYPNEDEVEDAVDVGALFLEATSRPFRSYMDEYYVGDSVSAQQINNQDIESTIRTGKPLFEGYTYTESFHVGYERVSHQFYIDCISSNKVVKEIAIGAKHPFYIRMIKFSFDFDLDYHPVDEHKSGIAFLKLMHELASSL